MREIAGFYTRKSDGLMFTYTARFTSTAWDAAVRTVDGSYSGFIRSQAADGLIGDALREAVDAWVQSCIEDRVGIE